MLADQLGADLLDGGEGHDRFRLFFRSAAGVDRLLGESGRDAVELICPSCRVSLDAEANDGLRDGGATTQDQFTNIERVTTIASRYDPVAEERIRIGRGDDLLIGNKFQNTLEGGVGPDLIVGGRASDGLRGGSGPDARQGGRRLSRPGQLRRRHRPGQRRSQ